MGLVYIWYDYRYWSEVLFTTILTPVLKVKELKAILASLRVCLRIYFNFNLKRLVGHEVKVSMTYISRSSDFVVHVYLEVCTPYFGIMNLYDSNLKFDHKINIAHRDLYCPVIWPYILKVIWCMNILILDYESVWPNVWPQSRCRSLWPIFHGPVILCYILKTVWCMNIIICDYGSVWPDIWPQNKCRSLWHIYLWPSDFVLYL